MGVVVPYPYANHEHIVVWVVETPGIFLCESNYRVVGLHHLQDEARQLDVLNHP